MASQIWGAKSGTPVVMPSGYPIEGSSILAPSYMVCILSASNTDGIVKTVLNIGVVIPPTRDQLYFHATIWPAKRLHKSSQTAAHISMKAVIAAVLCSLLSVNNYCLAAADVRRVQPFSELDLCIPFNVSRTTSFLEAA